MQEQQLVLGQELVAQQVLAVHFGFAGYGVYCFCRCFAVEQALVQQHAYVVLLLNAIQMTHSPTLFHLNVLLQYVHSWLVQSLRHYK